MTRVNVIRRTVLATRGRVMCLETARLASKFFSYAPDIAVVYETMLFVDDKPPDPKWIRWSGSFADAVDTHDRTLADLRLGLALSLGEAVQSERHWPLALEEGGTAA